MEFINKISIATVVGDVKRMVKEMKDGEVKAIMRIVGVANGTQVGESDMGPWVALKGDFKATNLIDKKEYVSGKCFLPGAVTDLIAGKLGGDIEKVQFAFDINIIEDIKSQVGYHYSAKPLVKPEENNAIALLEKQIA